MKIIVFLIITGLFISCGDTNTPPTDAPPPTDTNTPPTPPTDTNTPPTDTNIPPTDTNIPPTDTNTPPTDTPPPTTDIPKINNSTVFLKIKLSDSQSKISRSTNNENGKLFKIVNGQLESTSNEIIKNFRTLKKGILIENSNDKLFFTTYNNIIYPLILKFNDFIGLICIFYLNFIKKFVFLNLCGI